MNRSGRFYIISVLNNIKARAIILVSIGMMMLSSGTVLSQSYKRIDRQYEKGDFEKHQELLHKAIEKDSTDAFLWLMEARRLANPQDSQCNLEKAWSALMHAESLKGQLDEKDKRKASKADLDTEDFSQVRHQLDSQFYLESLQKPSIETFNQYLYRHGQSTYATEATRKRDSIAWDNTIQIDHAAAYANFIESYPQAEQLMIAKERYDSRLFTEATSGGRLKDFTRFHKQYSNSPYRQKVEEEIFRLSLINASPEYILNLIFQYPHASFSERLLLELALKPDFDLRQLEGRLRPLKVNELRKAKNDAYTVLFPFFENNEYRLVSTSGEEILIRTQALHEDYLCGNIASPILLMGQHDDRLQLYDRQSNLLDGGYYRQIQDLGSGLWQATAKSGRNAAFTSTGRKIHSGFYEYSSLPKSHFLFAKREKNGVLLSQSGVELIKGIEKVEEMLEGKILLISNSQGQTLMPREELISKAQSLEKPVFKYYEEIEYLLEENAFLAYHTDGIDWLNVEGKLLHQFEKVEDVFFTNQFYIVKAEEYYRLYRKSNFQLHADSISTFRHKEAFSAFEKDSSWHILQSLDTIATADNLLMMTPDFVGYEKDHQRQLYFRSTRRLEIPAGFRLNTWEVTNSEEQQVQYAILTSDREVRLYDQMGNEIFQGRATAVKYLGKQYMQVDGGQNKALYTIGGEQLLPFAYEGFGVYDQGIIPVLRARRFAIYDTESKSLSAFDYLQQPQSLSLTKVKVKTEEGTFLSRRNGQKIKNESFSDFRLANDSLMWIKNGKWKLVHQLKDTVFIDQVDQYAYSGQGIIISKQSGIGFYSPLGEEWVAPVYQELINIGSRSEPIYFAERSFREAGMHVVVYYDGRGNIIRRTAYTQEEYERVACDY
ncbi:MAG: hypothetical protein LAT68_08600 [Cyclobacteriaceae bacterium]|nr:hypothetical protein [Cyclobacteriaceae bacterium]MCH8516376.1 hypothetical protein [Cyclobacteriaceae bacterium]